MPDISNLGGHGHGLVGPVRVEIDHDSISLTGRYVRPRPWPLALSMVSGVLAGLLPGAWIAPPLGSSNTYVVRALAICLFALGGGMLGVGLLKAYVLNTAGMARLTFPLSSLRLAEDWTDVPAHPSPTPAGPLATGLASWLTLRFRSRNELLLLAPAASGSLELLRLVMDRTEDAATIAGRVRERLQTSAS